MRFSPPDPHVKKKMRDLAMAHMTDPEGILVIDSHWQVIPPPVIGSLADLSWKDLEIYKDEDHRALLYISPKGDKKERAYLLDISDDTIYQMSTDSLGRIRWDLPYTKVAETLTILAMEMSWKP